MIAFVIRRLLQSVLVMLAVAALAFWMFNSIGDPVMNMMGTDATEAQRNAMRELLGLNDSRLVQFIRFVRNVLHGDFGVSYRLGLPVSGLIVERLPATLELSFCAATLALLIGVPLGVYTGLHRHSALSRVFLVGSLVGVSLPTFLIGILLILFFAVVLGWLPSFGRGTTTHVGWWTTGFLTRDGLRALILPSITLCLFQLTLIMRLVRAEMMEVLRTDYIKFARARGLTNRAVNFGHALKNTLIPVITITGLQIGAIVAFAIVTETVFQWPGMGFLFIQAIQVVDIPIMATYLVLIAFIFVVINLIVDLLYYAVDPRLRIGRAAGAH